MVVDVERARAYAEALRELRAALDLAGDVSLADVLRFGDVVQPSRGPDAGDVDEALLRALVEEAAAAAVALREVEGERLRADFEARLDALAEELGRIEARAPERLVAERDRLREAVRALAEQDDVDEERLAREIAYLAEKWDIAEELVRFRSHIELFRETLAGDGEESVGKRLSFVVQEMHREANTIGSKANDATISQAAMALKEEIERLREQVENVE
ncbi:MAG: DUF1732 domain-containing protein [Gemmatimonadetes bacterium]|nr:MAG: DUF1732 domain-containing protein [Gemmatimonadota bacterium]